MVWSGSGGAETTDGTGGDTDAPSTGGASSGGTNSGAGGLSDSGGTGGTNAYPPTDSCSLDCDAPFLLYRPLDSLLPGDVVESGGGAVELTAANAYSGGVALASSLNTPGGEAGIDDTIQAVREGELYYRAWYFIPREMINGWIKIAAFHGADQGGTYIAAQSGGVLSISTNDGVSAARSESNVFPSGEWFCLQAAQTVRDSESKFQVSVNGEAVAQLVGADTLPGEGITRIAYGIDGSGGAQTPVTIYTDDVVVSTAPVACD